MERVFPRNARLSRVLGVLRILNHYDGRVKLSRLVRISRSDVDNLYPQLEAAKLLGLVKMQKEDAALTPLGLHLLKNDKGANAQILNKLKKYEPFKTAEKKIERGFSVEELALVLMEKKVMLHKDEKRNHEALRDMLMQWAIFFKLASYDGVSGKWSTAKRHTSPA
jgi:hypothetical protein